jgi:flagellar hook assembly protein FlgD
MGKEKSPIQLNIYNLRGQKVKTLFDGTLDSGNHNLIWDATDDNGRKVASGIYYCKLYPAGKNQLIKLLLLK